MPDSQQTIKQASDLQSQGKLDQAETLVREATLAFPDDWAIWNQLGHILYKKNQFKEARDAFEKSTTLDPSQYIAWTSLACVLKDLKDLTGAITAIQTAQSLAQTDHQVNLVLYNLACFYCLADHKAKTLNFLARACRLDPEIREWAKDDPDFLSLHDDPVFNKIIHS